MLRMASVVMHPFRRNSFLGRGGKVCRLMDTARSDASPLGAVSVRLLILLAALSITLVACSPGAERETQHAGEDAGQKSVHQGTTTSDKRAGAASAREGETTTTDSRAKWDYVALGDSLAAGMGARRGYVARYAEHLHSETGASVRVTNLGLSGQTSTQLLESLHKDPAMRKALSGAEVVTLNIGLNDLGQARSSYESGTCGGPQNQACLRKVVKRIERNWDAIIEEVLSFRSTHNPIIRTVGLGYTPQTEGTFEPYVNEVTSHIDSAAADGCIPYVEVRLGNEGMSADGLHPNDEGYRVIAHQLEELGYEPLHPR
ncbi:MAG: SGNH/GDSL hydrolase family protein [Actinomycetota bacterium]|nr:SGNH/GDSL hydrolase family protein [Rubrobacteraceae bacterium]MBA3635035.1 SGNH/GDSL hydrolase family protein [Rubrobacteraceae bacterium]MBA3703165.1 SGNH/GDSL hydrolase family protein [Rubrobacteraceae bacterium]MDQ3498688.1 SGNH/GDSL hydrolase family protein [Actinomycetota bacterium]